MTGVAARRRRYAGPALFSLGFRPFFLGGALAALLAMALFVPMLAGRLVLPTEFDPLAWHVHELLYGYVPAVIAGFLLTAVPNWTGRLPVMGAPLAALVGLWVAGRVGVFASGVIGALPAALLDCAFLALLMAVIAREILAGRSLRNVKILAVLLVLLAGNALFHAEAMLGRGEGLGMRLGLGATIALITLIGGRIIPSFTRNWLARRGPGRLPAPAGRFDDIAIAGALAALAAFVVAPDAVPTAALALLAGALHAARLARWAGERTLAEPLVLVLHGAYGFVPLGFFLLALAILRPDILAPAGALHGFTAGAITLMTLAVMTRASLGHTGRPLTATPPITALYLAAFIAAIARILAAFGVQGEIMLHVAAAGFMAAFAGFVVLYAPLLLRRRD